MPTWTTGVILNAGKGLIWTNDWVRKYPLNPIWILWKVTKQKSEKSLLIMTVKVQWIVRYLTSFIPIRQLYQVQIHDILNIILYAAYHMQQSICPGSKTQHFRITAWRSSRKDELFFNECQLSMWHERMVSSLLGDISEVTFRMESNFKLIHSRLWVMRISL